MYNFQQRKVVAVSNLWNFYTGKLYFYELRMQNIWYNVWLDAVEQLLWIDRLDIVYLNVWGTIKMYCFGFDLRLYFICHRVRKEFVRTTKGKPYFKTKIGLLKKLSFCKLFKHALRFRLYFFLISET